MTIHIKPVKDFPYDVNRREGTYFERDGFQVDSSVMKPHYCVGYQGNHPRLSAWARKQSKGLTNFAILFEGSTVSEQSAEARKPGSSKTFRSRVQHHVGRRARTETGQQVWREEAEASGRPSSSWQRDRCGAVLASNLKNSVAANPERINRSDFGKRENIGRSGAVRVLCPAVGEYSRSEIPAGCRHPSFG